MDALEAKRPSVRVAAVFVDFNSQLRRAPKEFRDLPYEACQFVIKALGKAIVKELLKIDNSSKFRVRLRLYHGWTTGTTPTTNRIAIAKLPEFEEPDTIYPSASVIALTEPEFGDRLLDALPERENLGIGVHLPDTARRQRKSEPLVEKMVDTALASDLLSWARSEPDSIAIVMSSDDDVVPPIFVAEAWMRRSGGCVRLIQGEGRVPNKYLQLEGLRD